MGSTVFLCTSLNDPCLLCLLIYATFFMQLIWIYFSSQLFLPIFVFFIPHSPILTVSHLYCILMLLGYNMLKDSKTLCYFVASKYFHSINYIILTFLIPEIEAFVSSLKEWRTEA